MSAKPTIPEDEQCDAETAGYDGMFGVYCTRIAGHDGLHCDGLVEWRDVATRYTSSGGMLDERHECDRED